VRWVKDHLDELKGADDPQVPAELHDRAADNWRPLIAIADVAGGTWPERARQAAVALTVTTEIDAESIRTMLLTDLRDLFEREQEQYLTSDDIVAHLIRLDERPWGDFKAGKSITKQRLAALLKPFGVRPKQTWSSSRNRKFYFKDDLADAFARYLPAYAGSQVARSLEPTAAAAFPALHVARNASSLATLKRESASIPAGSSDLATLQPQNGVPQHISRWRAMIGHQVSRDKRERRAISEHDFK